MSADSVAIFDQTMQDKGETSPFRMPATDPRGKSWLDGDNVFGATRGFQPFLSRLYGDEWKGGMLRQGTMKTPRHYAQLQQKTGDNGGMIPIEFNPQMGSK